jgi:hypothetical protein
MLRSLATLAASASTASLYAARKALDRNSNEDNKQLVSTALGKHEQNPGRKTKNGRESVRFDG